MKILFIFTGGTIGCTENYSIIGLDKDKKYALIEKYDRQFGIDFEYDVVSPYEILSENCTGKQIKALVSCVKNNIGCYDGIVVTHGTDTLQYSSAALGYCLGLCKTPVLLVSSNYPIENDKANGLYNLNAAICFIKAKKGKGVFVSYKNGTGDVIIHRATRLIASNAFSDKFYSVMNAYYCSFNGKDFADNKDYFEFEDEAPPLCADMLTDFSENILKIEPYAGMKYPKIEDKIKYVLHGSFHSGTFNTASENSKQFFYEAKEKGISVLLTGEIGQKKYESRLNAQNGSLFSVKPASPIAMYIKLWLIDSAGHDLSLMNKSIGGDVLE